MNSFELFGTQMVTKFLELCVVPIVILVALNDTYKVGHFVKHLDNLVIRVILRDPVAMLIS